MKTVELKRIGVKSVFKLFGGIFMVLGLAIGIFGSMAGVPLIQYTPVRFMPVFGLPMIAKIAIAGFIGIFLGLVYGIAVGIIYACGAMAYNIFAKIFGGIKLNLEERE